MPVLVLARAWLRIIWRCWQDGTAFDPPCTAAGSPQPLDIGRSYFCQAVLGPDGGHGGTLSASGSCPAGGAIDCPP
jgi:hypothetical protein